MDLVSDCLKYQFCCRDMLHNRAHDDHGVSSIVQSLRHVPLSSRSWTPCDMLQGQILHKCAVKECQRTREDMSLQHVHETCRGNFFKSVPTLRFGPCYMFLLHSPATCPISVYLTRFCPRYILQQHFPATCILVWAHLTTLCDHELILILPCFFSFKQFSIRLIEKH